MPSDAFYLILADFCNYAYHNLIQGSLYSVFASHPMDPFKCALYVGALPAFEQLEAEPCPRLQALG
jgi:hypothetical protein